MTEPFIPGYPVPPSFPFDFHNVPHFYLLVFLGHQLFYFCSCNLWSLAFISEMFFCFIYNSFLSTFLNTLHCIPKFVYFRFMLFFHVLYHFIFLKKVSVFICIRDMYFWQAPIISRYAVLLFNLFLNSNNNAIWPRTSSAAYFTWNSFSWLAGHHSGLLSASQSSSFHCFCNLFKNTVG